MYQPTALQALNLPGVKIVLPQSSLQTAPAASRFARPFSRSSKAISRARRTSRVLRLTLKAMRNSRAPMTVAPARGSNAAGPKSGFHFGSFSFSGRPSYSPARMSARLRREGSDAASS